jgi:hypothetical protein
MSKSSSNIESSSMRQNKNNKTKKGKLSKKGGKTRSRKLA